MNRFLVIISVIFCFSFLRFHPFYTSGKPLSRSTINNQHNENHITKEEEYFALSSDRIAGLNRLTRQKEFDEMYPGIRNKINELDNKNKRMFGIRRMNKYPTECEDWLEEIRKRNKDVKLVRASMPSSTSCLYIKDD